MLEKPFTLKLLSLVYNITTVSLWNRLNALVGTMMKLSKCHQVLIRVTVNPPRNHPYGPVALKKILWQVSVVVDSHGINPKYHFLRGVFPL